MNFGAKDSNIQNLRLNTAYFWRENSNIIDQVKEAVETKHEYQVS